MLDQEVGGGAELAAFLKAALALGFAELLYGVLELTREAGGVEAEFRDLIDGFLGCKRGACVRGRGGLTGKPGGNASNCFAASADRCEFSGAGVLDSSRAGL